MDIGANRIFGRCLFQLKVLLKIRNHPFPGFCKIGAQFSFYLAGKSVIFYILKKPQNEIKSNLDLSMVFQSFKVDKFVIGKGNIFPIFHSMFTKENQKKIEPYPNQALTY
jgi:hypothetical protein